jgi:hypothetical protein
MKNMYIETVCSKVFDWDKIVFENVPKVLTKKVSYKKNFN